MEGVKILSKEVINIPPDWYICLLPIVAITGIVSLVLLASGCERISCIFFLLFFLSTFFISKKKDVVETEIKQYKITPTTENYHIDLTKYEVLKVEQNIITIRERIE